MPNFDSFGFNGETSNGDGNLLTTLQILIQVKQGNQMLMVILLMILLIMVMEMGIVILMLIKITNLHPPRGVSLMTKRMTLMLNMVQKKVLLSKMEIINILLIKTVILLTIKVISLKLKMKLLLILKNLKQKILKKKILSMLNQFKNLQVFLLLQKMVKLLLLKILLKELQVIFNPLLI